MQSFGLLPNCIALKGVFRGMDMAKVSNHVICIDVVYHTVLTLKQFSLYQVWGGCAVCAEHGQTANYANWIIEGCAKRQILEFEIAVFWVSRYDLNDLMTLLTRRNSVQIQTAFFVSCMYRFQTVKFDLRGERFLACFLSAQNSLIDHFLHRIFNQFAALPAQFSKKACKFCFCPEWSGFNTILAPLLFVWMVDEASTRIIQETVEARGSWSKAV